VSDDDTRDAGVDGMTWVVRRTVMDISVFPRYLERFELITWCSGLGSRWAERRTTLLGEDGGRVEAATLWVALDPISRRPTHPSAEFLAIFGPSAYGRSVSSKLLLGGFSTLTPIPTAVAGWAPRFVDFDVMKHMNNAVYWEVVEGVLADNPACRAPLRVMVEHESPLVQGDSPLCRHARVGDRIQGELCAVGPSISADSATASDSATHYRSGVRFASFAIMPLSDS
jgi:acyl-ACP thioesterase